MSRLNPDARRGLIALGLVVAATVLSVVWYQRERAADLEQRDHAPVAMQPTQAAAPGRVQRLGRAEAVTPTRLEVSRIIGTEAGPLGEPHDLVVSEQYVAVLDRASLMEGRQLLLFDRISGELLESVGPPGQGPRDFERAQSLQLDLSDPDRVWINDYANGRMAFYDLSRLADGPVESLRITGSPFQAKWTRGGLFMSGLFATEVLRKFQRDDANDLAMVDAIGPVALESQPPATWSEWNIAAIAVHPEGTKLALSFVALDELRIYDADGTWTHQAYGPEVITPDFNARWRGYTFLAASTERIFALFVGRPREEDQYETTTVHVFDWEGRLLGEIELAEPIMRLAVSPSGETIWGIRLNPYPALVEFAPLGFMKLEHEQGRES